MADLAVIGGGLGGLLLVRSLLEHGRSGDDIALVDAADPERASDVPIALMHPFPGRSMEPKPGQMSAARASVDLLRALADELGRDAILELPMIRPLVGDLGERLSTTWRAARDDYPSWFECRLVQGDELTALEPSMNDFERALVYEPAFSVRVPRVADHLRRSFRKAGVEIIDRTRVEAIERRDQKWRLDGLSEQHREVSQVVLANGWQLRRWFPELPIRGRGGEVLLARPAEEVQLSAIVNASGHVAPRSDGTWAAGSTYFDPTSFEERSDDEARSQLVSRCGRLIPTLRDATPIAIWRGIRTMYRPDNRPLAGPVPGLAGVYVFGAFGSKGLLRIPALADQLAVVMQGDGQMDAGASTRRTDPTAWRPCSSISTDRG